MLDVILSSLHRAPASRFVYSSLGFFGSRRGGALPGLWFTRSLGSLGIGEATVRQTLWRMEKSGELEVRRRGRTKLYAGSPSTLAVIEAGTEKMLGPVEGPWDEEWTLVHFQFDAEDRNARDLVRDVLQVEGFARLGPGVYVHPRDRAARVTRAVGEMGLARHLNAFRGRRFVPGNDARFARRLWDLAGISERYRRFVRRYEPLSKVDSAAWHREEAFAVRFALVFDYLEVAWDDPELPTELLPDRWPGAKARSLVRRLYHALLPASIARADEILAGIHLPPAVGTRLYTDKR
jgi:phenylacetic acid degradation operon negative regulatory protein